MVPLTRSTMVPHPPWHMRQTALNCSTISAPIERRVGSEVWVSTAGDLRKSEAAQGACHVSCLISRISRCGNGIRPFRAQLFQRPEAHPVERRRDDAMPGQRGRLGIGWRRQREDLEQEGAELAACLDNAERSGDRRVRGEVNLRAIEAETGERNRG